MYKFYDLESMTQEDLNGLALERNILQEENHQLKDRIKKAIEYIENVYNSLENVDKPIMFFEEILKRLKKESE